MRSPGFTDYGSQPLIGLPLPYKIQYGLWFIYDPAKMRFSYILQGLPLLSASVYAATRIGPSADLHIANKFVQPDGFNRSWVHYIDSFIPRV